MANDKSASLKEILNCSLSTGDAIARALANVRGLLDYSTLLVREVRAIIKSSCLRLPVFTALIPCGKESASFLLCPRLSIMSCSTIVMAHAGMWYLPIEGTTLYPGRSIRLLGTLTLQSCRSHRQTAPHLSHAN